MHKRRFVEVEAEPTINLLIFWCMSLGRAFARPFKNAERAADSEALATSTIYEN